MKKQMYFILLAVILLLCFKGQTAYAEETPLQVEDNWLTREVARQVKKSDVKTLTQEDFEKVYDIRVYFNTKYYIETIPKEVALLKNLEYLLIDNKNLYVIPDELFTLSKLKSLSLNGNKLTEIPKRLFTLKQLEYLDLGHNKITELPKEIGQLSNLKSLSLGMNNLNGIPNEIFLLTSLTYLDLSHSNLDAIPEKISCFKNLKTLYLNSNNIKKIPKVIGELKNLNYLSLDANFIQELPVEIGKLNNMDTLSLCSNNIDEFPKDILKLTKLRQLSLNNNNINKIPEEISNLSNLSSFSVSGNKLTTIPKSIGYLSNLWQLSLYDNKIIEIPNSISKLINLSKLLLMKNKITEIPDCISKMTGLRCLWLSDNKISTIPKNIGNMVNLQELGLDDNEITSIPVSIGKNIRLTKLSLNNNKISYIPFEYTVKDGLMLVQNQQIELPLKKVTLNSSLEINCIKPVTHASIKIAAKNDGIYNKDKNTISWNVKTNTDNQLTYTFNMYYKNDGYTTFTGTVIQPIEIEGSLSGISLKKSELNLQVGKSALNEVVYNPQDTTDDKTVAWTSSNRNIATVTSKGKITGVSSGSAIVKAQVGKFTATCKVIVKDNSKPSENKIYFTDDYKDKTVTKDETIRIPIKLSTIKDYYALDSSIKYDKSKLEFLGYSIKENYKDCYADSSDVDILRFILASKGKNNPIKTSDDPIIYLNFKCIAAGDADVTITSTALANLDEEVNVKVDNLDKTTIHITETSRQTDINRDGKFSLIDLAIDAYYYSVDADETDKTKYDADIIPDGKIDDLDLIEITNNIINGK